VSWESVVVRGEVRGGVEGIEGAERTAGAVRSGNVESAVASESTEDDANVEVAVSAGCIAD
jgi:hypothetical protein